jgi:hypothetical protein
MHTSLKQYKVAFLVMTALLITAGIATWAVQSRTHSAQAKPNVVTAAKFNTSTRVLQGPTNRPMTKPQAEIPEAIPQIKKTIQVKNISCQQGWEVFGAGTTDRNWNLPKSYSYKGFDVTSKEKVISEDPYRAELAYTGHASGNRVVTFTINTQAGAQASGPALSEQHPSPQDGSPESRKSSARQAS